MKKREKIIHRNGPEVIPEVNEGEFLDSYGAIVKHGMKVILESCYSYQHLNGKEAFVIWIPKLGMYKYILIEDRTPILYDFYGVHKFKLIEDIDDTKRTD